VEVVKAADVVVELAAAVEVVKAAELVEVVEAEKVINNGIFLSQYHT